MPESKDNKDNKDNKDKHREQGGQAAASVRRSL